jgi:Ser/Thr protein kinase RdoA (MazF antagonist)
MPRSDTQLVSSSLMTNLAPITPGEAAAFAKQLFGVDGTATPLKGERDQNFVLRGSSGAFVLKITNPAEDRRVTDFQTRALLHVNQADPLLPVPELLRGENGTFEAEIDAGGQTRIARLMSFLPGTMAINVAPSSGLRTAIGGTLARLDRALSDFAYPEIDHDLSWDLKHATRLRHLLVHIENRSNRNRAERALDHFDAFVIPAQPHLREQVIHNDLSLFNVLVDETEPSRVLGVIDFGDLVRAPLINDLAIASSYHFAGDGDPLAPILEIVRAYHAEQPLKTEETDLLFDLVAMRMAMTILITEWRARRYPENRAYILKNHPAASLGLSRLDEISREAAQEQFRKACALEI